MQYHILCGRSGANHRIPLAISLEQTESCETYEFFARKCKQWGLGAVLQVEPGKFARRCCVVSDGARGTNIFTGAFAQPEPGKTAPFRSRCAKHLADSCRDKLRRMKKENPTVNCGFHDEQMYNIAAAASEGAFNDAMKSLNRNFPHAAKYLQNSDPSMWNFFHMAQKHGVGSFGHKTSNTVEGFNGTIVGFREKHPYICLDELIRYVEISFARQKIEARKWKEEGRFITPRAAGIWDKEKRLFLSGRYDVQATGDVETFHVCDITTKRKVRHTVCLSEEQPSCKPCNTWCQHKIPCRHMLAAMKIHKNHVFDNKESFFRCYFHPAYRVENLTKAYENIQMEIPMAKLGPDDAINLISSDDESNSQVQVDNRAPAPMLPPHKFTLENYKKNKKRGRKRKKRIRNRGAMSSDRGAPPPNYQNNKAWVDQIPSF